jgi:hypothetical protein
MTEPVTGRCFCGSIRFRFNQPPVAKRACWCRDCQYLSAGNASINLIFPLASRELEGEVRDYVSLSDGGNTMRRSFCPHCGTPLFSASSSRPDMVVVRAGALDDRELGRPEGFIWTASAPSWGLTDTDVPSCPNQPPPVAAR